MIEPFVAVSVGMVLGLLLFNFDNRPVLRKAGLALFVLPALVFANWYLLQSIFALVASGVCVWLLRRNLFSSVTSIALFSCMVSAGLIAAVLLVAGPELWQGLENDIRSFMLETMGRNKKLDPETLENLRASTNMMIWLLPGQFILMMTASIFGAILVFRHFGEFDLPLYLGCRQFRYYRFEDNWVWLLILALVLLLVSRQGWIGRVGINTLYVMGVLYLLRGVAVMFHFIALQGGGLLLRLLVVAICFPPLCLIHMFFGLLDTWLDFRKNVTAVGK
ncbi:MAG: DUF2232 domain-containing protein [Candidatus Glassbacteria bacterium]|nr:DUF2232 domain-containing protein [Candidatus Glassbacteria bacterium]